MGSSVGLPVIEALSAPLVTRSLAGAAAQARAAPPFRLIRPVPGAGVLVDDVVTTGTTAAAALAILPARAMITMTSSPDGNRPRTR